MAFIHGIFPSLFETSASETHKKILPRYKDMFEETKKKYNLEYNACGATENKRNIYMDNTFTVIEHESGDTIEYFKCGLRHRDDGPAIINGYVVGDRVNLSPGSKEYYLEGKLHRKGGPASIIPK